MLQIRSRLDVADNTGARMAKMIGVIGKKNSPEARVGDVITAHIREASAGGTVKKGDDVQVITGNHKGSTGKVLQVFPTKQQVLIEGVRMIKKHTKKSQDNPQGAIIQREGPIHISNVKRVEQTEAASKAPATKSKSKKKAS